MKVSKTKDFSCNTSSKGGARSPYVEAKDMIKYADLGQIIS